MGCYLEENEEAHQEAVGDLVNFGLLVVAGPGPRVADGGSGSLARALPANPAQGWRRYEPIDPSLRARKYIFTRIACSHCTILVRLLAMRNLNEQWQTRAC
jgi:hypothetical protein